jgi:hypothetical protein
MGNTYHNNHNDYNYHNENSGNVFDMAGAWHRATQRFVPFRFGSHSVSSLAPRPAHL